MADAEEQRRATARGERIRAELVTHLGDGPAGAADLLPQIETPDVSISEVAFQLVRLAEEGRAVGEQGESFRLAN